MTADESCGSVPVRSVSDVIEVFGRPHAVERSIKFLPGEVRTDRFLLSYPAADFGAQGSRFVSRVRDRLDGPLGIEPIVESLLGRAGWLHIGLECSVDRVTYKLYFEFQEEVARLARAEVREGRHALVHRALRWTSTSDGFGTTDYRCDPRRPDSEVDQLVEGVHLPHQHTLKQSLRSLVAEARKRIGPRRIMLLEVRDDKGLRSSVDLNIYGAALSLGCAWECLGEALGTFATLSGPPAAILSAGDAPVGHISAGTARDGRPFLTLYFDEKEGRAQ